MLYYVYNNNVGIHKDVTSIPRDSTVLKFNDMSFDNGTTWISTTTIVNRNSINDWLVPFSIRKNYTSLGGEFGFGFSMGNGVHGGFPQPKEGRMYLAVVDVRNSGAALGNIWGYASSFATYTGLPQQNSRKQSFFPIEANQTEYTRVWGKVSGEAGRFFFSLGTAVTGTTIVLDIKNWRQFDVTGWTDDQIEDLAMQPNFDEVYLTRPTILHGRIITSDEDFLNAGGIIRNDGVDEYMYVHDIGFNYNDIP